MPKSVAVFFGRDIFLWRSEEVSVDLFASTVCGLAEKDEDVIALGEFSGIDRQRGERPIFAELEFAGPAPEDFPRDSRSNSAERRRTFRTCSNRSLAGCEEAEAGAGGRLRRSVVKTLNTESI